MSSRPDATRRLSDPARLAAVEQTGLLGAPPAEPFERATELVQTFLDVPVAVVSVIGDGVHTVLAERGLPPPLAAAREIPFAHSYCRRVVEQAEPLVLNDTLACGFAWAKPAAVRLGMAAYLGVPVCGPSGHVLGTICAVDAEAREWTDQERTTLEALAATVESEIALRAEIERRAHAEAQYRTLFEESPDPILLLDPETEEVLDANAAAADLYGTSRDRLLGMSVRAFSQNPEAGDAIARQLLADGGRVQFDTVQFRQDGTPIDLHVSATTAEIDGRPVLLTINRDVSALRAAERELAETRAHTDRLALVAAKTTNGVIITDPDGRTEWVNEGFTRITGYTLDELRGRQPGHLLQGPDTDPKAVAYMRERLRAQEPFSVEILNYRKDGVPYWIQIEVSPLVEGGRFTGFMAIESDVSERKEAETALRESEARFRLLADTATDVILTVDDRGVVQYANAALEPVFGYAPDDFVGRDIWSTVPDRFRQSFASAFVDYLASGERSFGWANTESYGRRRDGTELPIAVSFGEYHQGDRRYFTAIVRDISAQKEAEAALQKREAQYRTVVEAVRDAVVETDAEGILTFVNPAWQAITGVPAAKSLGRSVYDFVHPDELDRGDAFLRLIRREVPFVRIESRFRHADGEVRHVEIHAEPRYADDGSVMGVVGTVTDITDSARFKAEQEARQRTEEMLRLKDTFLSNMSHELRTPLTGILGFAEVLTEEVDDEQREYAEAIVRGGRRLQDTLNSVLDLAQLEAGAVRIRVEPVDLRAEAAEAADLLRPMARQAGLELVVTGDAPALALADRAAAHRVLHNLVGNAIKFTSDGRVTVHVEAAGARTLLRVSDTGIGIPADFLPRLFGEFTQASEGDTRTHEGNGLGLAITQRLVELMGGEISVESTEGVGTTFTVAFPVPEPSPERTRR